MGELRDEIDLSTWRVRELPPDFADRVLDRIEALDDELADSLEAIDGELDDVLWALDEEAERIAPPRPLQAARRTSVAPIITGVVVAAAAALLVWLWPDAPAPSLPPPPVAAPPVVPADDQRVAPQPTAAPVVKPTAPEPLDLDRDKIREAVSKQFIPVAQRCYNDLLRRDATAEGRVTLRIEVVRDGDRGIVDACDVVDDQSDLADETFRACLVSAMKAVIFEPPARDDRVQIVYPIVFRPGSNGEQGVIVGM